MARFGRRVWLNQGLPASDEPRVHQNFHHGLAGEGSGGLASGDVTGGKSREAGFGGGRRMITVRGAPSSGTAPMRP